MAAVAAPQAPSALTPPSSSQGGQIWDYSVPSENSAHSKSPDTQSPPPSQTNGHAISNQSSRTELSQRRPDTNSRSDSNHLAPARVNAVTRKDSSISDSGSAPDSLLDLYGNKSGFNTVDYGDRKVTTGPGYGEDEDPDHSRWIHRDKLARIESQELQAAGIILPRARAASKSSRREHSREHGASGSRSEHAGQKRQRMDSFPREEEEEADISTWDLRLPEEVAGDPGDPYKDLLGLKGVSRIPVCKTSPLPIPPHHLERDTPMIRKQNAALEDEIQLPKTRGRSQSIKILEDYTATPPTPAKRIASEQSPTKKTVKKGSSHRTTSAPHKTKKSQAHNRDTSNQRPTTRGSDLNTGGSISKRPEGDPPWLATMYKPDPRLPPDQQLLPTVARRLQQEQWAREGKFGNVYDTDFNPLNDEVPTSPEPPTHPSSAEIDPTSPIEIEQEKAPNKNHQLTPPASTEWPLRAPSTRSVGPRSPGLSSNGRPGTSGGYSTMPKITGAPQGMGPMQTPRPILKVPVQPEEKAKEGGLCGCCVVM